MNGEGAGSPPPDAREPPRPGRFWRRLLILIGITAAGLYGLLSLAPPGGAGDGTGPWLVQSTVVIIILLAGLAASRQSLPAIARQMAAWLLILTALVAGYGYRFELAAVLDRVRAELMPTRGQPLDDGTLAFRRGADGQFRIDAMADGWPIRFMVDTGASGVVLTRDDAARLGIPLETLRFTQSFSTANGITRGAPIRLGELRIGPWSFPNVPASVNEGQLAQSLLGMRFLGQLGGIDIRRDSLILRH